MQQQVDAAALNPTRVGGGTPGSYLQAGVLGLQLLELGMQLLLLRLQLGQIGLCLLKLRSSPCLQGSKITIPQNQVAWLDQATCADDILDLGAMNTHAAAAGAKWCQPRACGLLSYNIRCSDSETVASCSWPPATVL